jgi:hypothetical protein
MLSVKYSSFPRTAVLWGRWGLDYAELRQIPRSRAQLGYLEHDNAAIAPLECARIP